VTTKRGTVWEWSLRGTEATGMVAADLPPPVARADIPAGPLAEVAGLLERALSILNRIEGSAPAPAAGGRAGDWRTKGTASPRAGRWGAGTLVRCAECARFPTVSDSGQCAAGGLQSAGPMPGDPAPRSRLAAQRGRHDRDATHQGRIG
jgi:hypothetical protein